MRFRKKPVVVEAIRLDKIQEKKVIEFLGGESKRNIEFSINFRTGQVRIYTNEGAMTAEPGDWIIKEPVPIGRRQYYPCKPDIFEQTYEPVND